VCVGTVSVTSGKYKVFDQFSPNFINAVIASASFPGMLSPVSFGGELWTDGGVKEISPITTAIEQGADEIDVIITSPTNKVKRFVEKPTTVDVLKRIIDLSTDRIMNNDIEKVEVHNKLVKAGLSDKKYVQVNILRPNYNLTDDLLDFNPQKLREMHDRGYYDATCNYAI
jgi:NTE family protein